MSTGDEEKNRLGWNAFSDTYQSEHNEELLAAPLAWGVWRVPEEDLRVLGNLGGLDVLELGCGAAQWSKALIARGVSCVGLDLSIRQLGHAGGGVPLVNASATLMPFATDSFDVVFADHGAPTFADPHSLVPEVARVLRPGGLFAFCLEHPLRSVCYDDPSERTTKELLHDYFGLFRLDEADTVSFVMPHGERIRLFRTHGFEVEDLIEVRAPEHAQTSYRGYAENEWARRWPAEEIWKVRLSRRS